MKLVTYPHFIRSMFYKKDIIPLTKPKQFMKIFRILSSYCTIDNKIILDVGCDSGIITQLFNKESNMAIGVDIVNNFCISKNLQDTYFLLADGQQLPFKDECVDIIISNHILHHVQNQKKIVNEFHRILKPGGITYIGEGFGGYNLDLRTYWRIKNMMSNFILKEETINVLKDLAKYSIDIPKPIQWVLKLLPTILLKFFLPITPSWIFIAIKQNQTSIPKNNKI